MGGSSRVVKKYLRQLFRYKSRDPCSSSCRRWRYNNVCIIYFRRVFFIGSRLNTPTSSAVTVWTPSRGAVRIYYTTTVVHYDHSNHNTYKGVYYDRRSKAYANDRPARRQSPLNRRQRRNNKNHALDNTKGPAGAGLTFSSGQTICHYYCRYYYIFRGLLFLTGGDPIGVAWPLSWAYKKYDILP